MMVTWQIRHGINLLLGFLCLALPGTAAAAILQASSTIGQPGQALQIALLLTRSAAEAVASLQCDLRFDAAVFTLNSITPSGAVVGAGKQLSANQVSPGRWRIVVVGFNQNEIPAGEIAIVSLTSAEAAPQGSYGIQVTDVVMSDVNAQPVAAQGSNGTVTLGPAEYHSADFNQNYVIDLTELLRGIQLFNAGQLSCDNTSEDGYAIGAGPQDCSPHDSDYKDSADWRISLTELLRLIQYFNVGGYAPSDTSEDGFDPRAVKQ